MLMFIIVVLFGVGDATTYIPGALLGSLAKSAALQANNAFSHQQVAASYASFSAKNNLAEAAWRAASAAQAALAGKKSAVLGLKLRLEDAQKTLQSEIDLYKQLQGVAFDFAKAAQESRDQAEALEVIVEAAKNASLSKISKINQGLKDKEVANLTQQINIESATTEMIGAEQHISFGSGFHR